MTVTKRELVLKIAEDLEVLEKAKAAKGRRAAASKRTAPKAKERAERGKGRSERDRERADRGRERSERGHVTQLQVLFVLQKALDYIAEALARGDKVELRNFGIFEVRVSKARIGRNPHEPGTEVPIPPRSVVKFRAGKEMRAEVRRLPPPPPPKPAPRAPKKKG